MGKSGDVKRGGSSRFSAAMRQTGGDSDESSKKEKLKRLSSVGKISEMDQSSQSIGANTISKRVKLPKKFFDDCDTVNHASVPRKLRSAMKNRIHKSVSPSAPSSRNGIRRFEMPSKHSRKKLKLDVEEHQHSARSPKESIVVERTIDEEEVAEALVALAATFPGNEKADEINLNNEASEAEPLTTPEQDGPKAICQTHSSNEVANHVTNFIQESEATRPAETCAPVLQPSSTKLPAWLANATQLCPAKTVCTKKDTKDVTNGKSWKRCSAHVYICRLINVLQVRDEGTKQRAHVNVTADTNPQTIVNDYADKTTNEASTAVVLHKLLFQDQQPACGVEARNHGPVNKSEAASTQFHAPHLHSIAQIHASLPLTHPQNRHFSAAAGEQVNTQAAPYFGSPLYDPSQWLSPVLPKQQQMWVNQFMPGARWQNGRRDMMPPYSSSLLEMLGSEHAQNTPQQQQYVPISSLLASNKGKMQFSHHPSGYDENGGLFLVDSSPTLKLTSQ